MTQKTHRCTGCRAFSLCLGSPEQAANVLSAEHEYQVGTYCPYCRTYRLGEFRLDLEAICASFFAELMPRRVVCLDCQIRVDAQAEKEYADRMADMVHDDALEEFDRAHPDWSHKNMTDYCKKNGGMK